MWDTPGKAGLGFPSTAWSRAEGPFSMIGVEILETPLGVRVRERVTAHPVCPTCVAMCQQVESHMQSSIWAAGGGTSVGQSDETRRVLESLVQWPLENEADTAMLASEPGPTKGTGSMESMGTMGQRCLGPVAGSLLRADVATRSKGMTGWPRVQAQASLLAKP